MELERVVLTESHGFFDKIVTDRRLHDDEQDLAFFVDCIYDAGSADRRIKFECKYRCNAHSLRT